MELVELLSAHTCSEACWFAREEVCRCSCNGKHHGAALRGIDTGQLAIQSRNLAWEIKKQKKEHAKRVQNGHWNAAGEFVY